MSKTVYYCAVKDAKIQHMLRMTIDAGRAAIIILDSERIIRYANVKAAKMMGVPSPEHLLNQAYIPLLQKTRILEEDGTVGDATQFPSTLALDKGITTLDKVYENIRRGGLHFWLSIDAMPFFGLKGTPEYVMVRFVDISEKKWKEDRLKFLVESNRALSLTSDYKTVLIEKAKLIVPTLADFCTVNIVNRDDTTSRIAIIHRDLTKVGLVEEMAEAAQKTKETSSLQRILREGTGIFHPTITEEYLNARPPRVAALMKELQISSMMILPIISRGRIVGLLTLMYAESGKCYTNEDVRFMEEYCHHLGMVVDNARLYEEVKNHDKAKDNFLAALSHELRNPIAPIKSSLEMMQLTHDSPKCKGEIEIVQRQFEHFTNIINDLLDVTRFTRGKIHFEKGRLDLSTLMSDIAASYAPFIEERGITFAPVIAHGPILVQADAVRLKQAVMNLLDNAQKFTPPGGRISLSLSQVQGNAVISVRDSGIGIAEGEIGRIFDLHFQGSNKEYGTETGLGLGLVLVREIVNLHAGTIEVKSEGAGRGFECTIRIPVEVEVAVRV